MFVVHLGYTLSGVKIHFHSADFVYVVAESFTLLKNNSKD